MFTMMRTTLMAVFVFTILTGILYPLAVTGLAQLLFPVQANGSVIVKNGNPIGSALIGQQFDKPEYFWGRLSATSPFPYNAAASSGPNLSQTNPGLLEQAKGRITALRNADPGNTTKIPVDLATASGSGLDPHISPAAAEYQVKRVAKARGLDGVKVKALVAAYTEQKQFGVLGEPRVNVLKLNMALDELR